MCVEKRMGFLKQKMHQSQSPIPPKKKKNCVSVKWIKIGFNNAFLNKWLKYNQNQKLKLNHNSNLLKYQCSNVLLNQY